MSDIHSAPARGGPDVAVALRPIARTGAGAAQPTVFRALDALRRSLPRDPAAARAAALQLAERLAEEATPAPSLRGGLAPWQQRSVEAYMRRELGNPVRLRDLAAQASRSVSHFSRAFRQSFGTTPREHLTRLRIERAQQLMLSTDEPLSRIALACGMADQAHLSKSFRRVVGESPGLWRRRHATGRSAAA